MSDDITPFRIDIPEADLDDLRQRLGRTRWPEAATVGDWSQGVPLGYAREFCRYWLEDYDWRACETRLNAFPQFQTEIDGQARSSSSVRSSARSPTQARTAGTPRTPSTWSARHCRATASAASPAARGGGPGTPPTPRIT